jgi:hypothetical protein
MGLFLPISELSLLLWSAIEWKYCWCQAPSVRPDGNNGPPAGTKEEVEASPRQEGPRARRELASSWALMPAAAPCSVHSPVFSANCCGKLKDDFASGRSFRLTRPIVFDLAMMHFRVKYISPQHFHMDFLVSSGLYLLFLFLVG